MKIINSVFEKSSKTIGQCPQNSLPEYAFVGRSNVGKSSLINSILNNTRGITIVMITHRKKNLANCSRVFKVINGSIIEKY